MNKIEVHPTRGAVMCAAQEKLNDAHWPLVIYAPGGNLIGHCIAAVCAESRAEAIEVAEIITAALAPHAAALKEIYQRHRNGDER